MLIDTHCHLDFSQFDSDREAVIKRTKDNKIKYLINVGSSIESSFKSKDLADKFDNIFFSIGLHPHYADEFNKVDIISARGARLPPACWTGRDGQGSAFSGKLEELINSKKLVAIGEVGLDYFKSRSDRDKQKEVFLEFISLAKRLKLPLIIHCRDSQSDIYSILKDEFNDFRKIVFHCFSGPVDFLDKCLNLKAMFSFTANITYPKATKLKELAKRIPLDRIMIETDSPYLAPQKFRGQRNEPSYTHFVAQELASLRNISFQEIASITTQNAINFFNLNED
ncbi:MAG: TatD family hydrolase [Candidatus Omnitrophica bacterium]|nr:TatD family hydrolase [Candidatus Omnitrophota bacterium]